jgi:hypothetical protein
MHTRAHDTSFTGEWANCNQIKGTNTWFDGRTYSGEYLAGEKSGQVIRDRARDTHTHNTHLLIVLTVLSVGTEQGTYTWNDGSVYKGGWSRGLRHGEGRMEWPDGTWFTVLFANTTRIAPHAHTHTHTTPHDERRNADETTTCVV